MVSVMVTRDRYAKQTKTERNKTIIDMVENRKDLSLEAIGKIFNITKQRVWYIYQAHLKARNRRDHNAGS